MTNKRSKANSYKINPMRTKERMNRCMDTGGGDDEEMGYGLCAFKVPILKTVTDQYILYQAPGVGWEREN